MAQPENPLAARRRDAFAATDLGNPRDLDGYCAWLNAKEMRPGTWEIVTVNGKRAIDWRARVASEDWLRERGLLPRIGRAA